jgi:cysteine sulfinate desulfinase/cysteine desulfurase-like protein
VYSGPIRIGIGRFTTEEEVDYAIDLISSQVSKMR